MKVISKKADYINLVGDNFTIFCGSFISAMDNVAPTVPIVRQKILTELSSYINEGNDRVAIKLSNLIINILNETKAKRLFLDPNAVINGIQRIKFEELMRRLGELHSSNRFIDDVVNAIFPPEETGFNINHLAVANLLANGQCHCVFTTNFDTAIENACRAIGYSPSVVTLSDSTNITTDTLKGKIFKLHGCAKNGDVVANSTVFYRILVKNHFSVLTETILKKPCLFFGYSGYGDIDISPHIRRVTKASNILWSNHLPTGNPFPGSTTVVSDLMTNDHSKNFLLGLASKFGAKLNLPTTISKDNEKFAKLLRSDCTPAYAVDAFLDLVALYHPQINALYWYARGKSNFIRHEASILKDPRLLSIPLNKQCRHEIRQYGVNSTFAKVWSPFIEWRVGSSNSALTQINDAIDEFDYSAEVDRIAIIKIINIGLSIIAEELWCCSPRKLKNLIKRRKYFLNKADYWATKSWWNELESVDEAIARNKRIIEINYLKSKNRSIAKKQIAELFNLCINLELFVRLIGVIHSAWLLDRELGDKLFAKISNLPIPSNLLISVKKRNFSHRFYNTPIIGRRVYWYLERVLPRIVEQLYNIWFSSLGYVVMHKF